MFKYILNCKRNVRYYYVSIYTELQKKCEVLLCLNIATELAKEM